MNTISYEEARRFLEIAQKGDERIVTSLAIAYYEGYGVEQDYAKALECYQKAAELGYDVAQCDLAYMYKTGKGTPKDMEKAFYWYMKSAEQGFSDAQLELGVLYHNGTGVKQDYMKSYYWYKKAADQGNVKAQENINLMLFFNEITEEDIKAEESPKKRKDAKTLLKGLEASDFIQQADELFESGSFELAKVNYTGAYARDSRFAFYCYYRLAWIEEMYDNHEEALQLCEKGIARKKDYARLYLLKGDILKKQLGKEAAAEKCYRKCLMLEEGKIEESVCWHLACAKLGLRDQAVEGMNRMLEAFPDDARQYYDAACMYCALQEFDTALRYLETSIEMGFSMYQIRYDYGMDPMRDTEKFEEIVDKYDPPLPF